MTRSQLLIAAYTLDQILGDPERCPHPIRLIGLGITQGERALRRPNQSPALELLTGATLTFAIVAAAYTLTAQIIRRAHRISPTLGTAVSSLAPRGARACSKRFSAALMLPPPP